MFLIEFGKTNLANAFSISYLDGGLKSKEVKLLSRYKFSVDNPMILPSTNSHGMITFLGWMVLSCQPRVTVTSCFVYKVIMD